MSEFGRGLAIGFVASVFAWLDGWLVGFAAGLAVIGCFYLMDKVQQRRRGV